VCEKDRQQLGQSRDMESYSQVAAGGVEGGGRDENGKMERLKWLTCKGNLKDGQ
jgi:hypothetical protein